MVRLGWGLIVVGSLAAAWIVFQFYLAMVVDPTMNDPLWGFLMACGLSVGGGMALAGAIIVANASGRRGTKAKGTS